jgi:hypothetical protein
MNVSCFSSALGSLLLAAFGAAHATDIHVPGDWPTIQQGIAAAVDGDRVLVGEGLYDEAIDFLGKNIEVLAAGSRYGTRISATGHPHAVVFQSGESSAVLAGFTIEGGRARDAGLDSYGGGVLVAGTAAPEIRDNLFRGNRACAGGGLAVLDSARPRIHDNEFAHNEAKACSAIRAGGALYIASPALVVIEHNRFYRNVAGRGGAIAVVGDAYRESKAIVARNYLYRNAARSAGGGIYSEGDHVRILDNLVVGNGSLHGGGVEVLANSNISHPVLVNNTIVDNSGGQLHVDATPDGQVGVVNNIIVDHGDAATQGVHCEGGPRSNIVFHDNLLYSPNGATARGPCRWDGLLLKVDPRFVGGSGIHTYWLQSTSPAIDSGEDYVVGRFRFDLSGAPRILGPAVDMGAFEYRQD